MNPERTESADRRAGVVILSLLGLAVLFLGLTVLHNRPADAFELRASSFAGFNPRLDGWAVERMPVSHDPIEPNILCYRITPRGPTVPGSGPRAAMPLRLVHGYNVRDCMRIKGYRVEEVVRHPSAVGGLAHPPVAERTEVGGQRTEVGGQRTEDGDGSAKNQAPGTKNQAPGTKNQAPGTTNQEPGTFGQTWRMVSPAGVTSLWSTVMLRADTFEATDRDVCSMPFPRVAVPDDPDWSPGGITAEGLRHPVANTRKVVRAKWNASRSDVLTFLGFRKPAWVQAEWLTLVVAGEGGTGAGQDERAVATSLKSLQTAFVRELTGWHAKRNSRRE